MKDWNMISMTFGGNTKMLCYKFFVWATLVGHIPSPQLVTTV